MPVSIRNAFSSPRLTELQENRRASRKWIKATSSRQLSLFSPSSLCRTNPPLCSPGAWSMWLHPLWLCVSSRECASLMQTLHFFHHGRVYGVVIKYMLRKPNCPGSNLGFTTCWLWGLNKLYKFSCLTSRSYKNGNCIMRVAWWPCCRIEWPSRSNLCSSRYTAVNLEDRCPA